MFKKVLIANRGEIALRVVRALRELNLKSVVVHSTADQDSLAVKLADESVCIGPARSTDSYLSIPKILSAAEITGADAIHPGYGFLAENAEFARVCERCGIEFIGPSGSMIELMGDKLGSRRAVSELGLPLLKSLKFTSFSEKDLKTKVNDELGYPVIIKASAGGGGKGIKIVRREDELLSLALTAKAEARAAFGDDTIYVEKYLEEARHVELQVLFDKFGNGVCIGDRDCSMQRRYQKVIEEASAPNISQEAKDRISSKVIDALHTLKYQNVGTVEFLMDKDENFYFLEMNTRIQVEHPVTEEVFGVDLLKEQIKAAAGEKLTFASQDLSPRGHALELRINAETAFTFKPSPGKVDVFHLPGGHGIRVDTACYQGATVSPHYDSLLAKLIVHAGTRDEAISRALSALKEFQIQGVETNIELHQAILKDQKFREGQVSTHYLDNMLKTLKK